MYTEDIIIQNNWFFLSFLGKFIVKLMRNWDSGANSSESPSILRPELAFSANLAVIFSRKGGLGAPPPGEFPPILRPELAFSAILAVIFSRTRADPAKFTANSCFFAHSGRNFLSNGASSHNFYGQFLLFCPVWP